VFEMAISPQILPTIWFSSVICPLMHARARVRPLGIDLAVRLP
jgi:hypothetical protein